MPTIAKEFSEIYGNNGPLGKRNASINNMLKNISPNQNFVNNMVEDYNKNMNKPVSNDLKKPFEFPYLTVFFVTLFFVLCVVIYLNRETITQFFSKLVKPKPEEPIKKPEEVKPEEVKPKEVKQDEVKPDSQDKNIKQKEAEEKEKLKKIENGGVKQLDKKLNENYMPEQIVKENSYCYIGYDNGQRECTNVFDGDICMSGELFPKMEMCINPNLRA